MEINYLLIEEENEQDLASVLPPELNREENRICIGAVDENNAVLGAISYFLVRYEYVIDWGFVVPPVRRRRVGAGLLGKVIETILHAGDLFPIVARFPYTDKEHAVFSLFQSEERMTTSYSHERFVVNPKELANAARLYGKRPGRRKGRQRARDSFLTYRRRSSSRLSPRCGLSTALSSDPEILSGHESARQYTLGRE